MQCRVCMQFDCEIVDMSTVVTEDGKTLFDYFNECTQLNATSIDNLPKILCVSCVENLQAAYNFRKDALRSDGELKKMLALQKVEPMFIHSPTEQLEILEEFEAYKDGPLCVSKSGEQYQLHTSMALSEESIGMVVGDTKTEISVEILLYSDASTQDNEDRGSTYSPIFSCDICNFKHPTKNSLKDHIIELHMKDITCTKCSMVFELPKERRLHDKLVHMTESPIFCPWCKYSRSIPRNELIEHVQTDHNSSYLKYFPPSSRQDVDNHSDEHYQNSFPFDYDLDETKQDHYETHIQSTHNHSIDSTKAVLTESEDKREMVFECYICPKQFRGKQSLQRHIKTKHKLPENVKKSENQTFACGNRRQQSTENGRKINHEDNDANTISSGEAEKETSNEYLVTCKYCNKKISATKISSHESQHVYRLKKRGKYICSLCPREFVSEINVKLHERRVHLHQRPEPKECPICHKKFDSKYFKTHIANVHASERKFICDICGDSYKSNLHLTDHKRLHYERKFPCTLCNKKFVRAIDLKVHMRCHTGEKPFACNLCDQRFRVRAHLTYHLQQHAGIKRKCKDCDKEFNDIKQLKVHSYKHTGMPYRCNVCNYSCALRNVFRKHLLRVHDMTMTPAEYCAMFKANTGRNSVVRTLEELQSEAKDIEGNDFP